ncbi:hypothetical protein F4560_008730 [Saccharothrix ecbatanensis]|uniref:Uncharacterized protein n=1 Tax=Saccharothrix ecbatanensis TaxID=1105145 RepID=A0A7W9M661_9PSEU|nr:hypothetical protein [Saccharothrix ecbatanensis]MBB5808962.1 hypothetical protein [Saccharothrix ecbatanensis]
MSEVPHAATWDEIQRVFGGSHMRMAMLLTARSRLEQMAALKVPIAAVWVNGSFVTSVEQPSDIDIAVLVNGPELKSIWQGGDVDHVEATRRVRHCLEERYEPGGMASEHLTDFRGIYWFPEGHDFYHDSVSELDHWSALWSRVKVGSSGHTGGEQEFVSYDNSKGFVEVRWSS